MRAIRCSAAAALAVGLVLSTTSCAIIAGSAVVGGVTGLTIHGTPRVQPGAPVQLRLPTPRDVALLAPLATALAASAPSAPSDTSWLRAATLLVGRATAVRGDTVWLRLTEVRGSEGRVSYPVGHGPMVRLTGAEASRVEPLGSRPMAALLGAALGAAAGTALLWLLCSVEPCFN